MPHINHMTTSDVTALNVSPVLASDSLLTVIIKGEGSGAGVCQAFLEAVLTSANQRHSAAIANVRSTIAIEKLIERLDNQLDAILNSI